MKIRLKHRTATRLIKAKALAGFNCSMWSAGNGFTILKIFRADDPQGIEAKLAFSRAWCEKFKGV